MRLKDRIEGRLYGNKKHSTLNADYVLCKEFGWDYHTLMSQPIPFVMGMLDRINHRIKEEEKATKKKR